MDPTFRAYMEINTQLNIVEKNFEYEFNINTKKLISFINPVMAMAKL